ncbi:hypothetical protein [Nocardioides sp. P5_C9_2]
MTRLLLGLVAVVLLSSCSSTGDPASGRADEKPDAAAFKQQMDTEAQALLPDLVSELGGSPNGLQASFVERGGFGLWDYTASGVLSRPRGAIDAKLDTASAVLEQHGYTVERDEAQLRVRATKDDIGVTVQAGMPTTDPDVRSVSVRMANVGALEDGDDFAESAPPEDYLAYLD